VTSDLRPTLNAFSLPLAISLNAIVREILAQPQNSMISNTSGLDGGAGNRCHAVAHIGV
jgi:hypothetical protein